MSMSRDELMAARNENTKQKQQEHGIIVAQEKLYQSILDDNSWMYLAGINSPNVDINVLSQVTACQKKLFEFCTTELLESNIAFVTFHFEEASQEFNKAKTIQDKIDLHPDLISACVYKKKTASYSWYTKDTIDDMVDNLTTFDFVISYNIYASLELYLEKELSLQDMLITNDEKIRSIDLFRLVWIIIGEYYEKQDIFLTNLNSSVPKYKQRNGTDKNYHKNLITLYESLLNILIDGSFVKPKNPLRIKRILRSRGEL